MDLVDKLGMQKPRSFRPLAPEQTILLPHSFQEWLVGLHHLVYFLLGIW